MDLNIFAASITALSVRGGREREVDMISRFKAWIRERREENETALLLYYISLADY
jgi:hypothetical protein